VIKEKMECAGYWHLQLFKIILAEDKLLPLDSHPLIFLKYPLTGGHNGVNC